MMSLGNSRIGSCLGRFGRNSLSNMHGDSGTNFFVNALRQQYASGISGAFWDFSSAQYLYQDSARTTPVRTTGDVIGSATDLSNHGFHLSASGSSRPTWQLKYGSWDGFDDVMTTNPIDFTNTTQITIIVSAANATTAQAVLMELGTVATTGFIGLQNPTSANKYRTNFRYSSGGVVQFDYTKTNGTVVLLATYDFSAPTDPGKLALRENGVNLTPTVSITSPQAATTGANAALSVGARSGGTLFYAGGVYRAQIIGKFLTTSERNTSQLWAAQPAGVIIT